MPRILYAMSCDGLMFKPFAAVLPKLKTPWIASLFTGIIGGMFVFFGSDLVKRQTIWS